MIIAPGHVRSALSVYATPQDDRVSAAERRAGVAIVLAGADTDPHVCFMQRVERADDRWSGDIAFPGGWADTTDESFRDAAVRETREEVGLDLRASEHLGDLPVTAISTGTGTGDIAASVFYIGTHRATLRPEPREVADAFWVSGHHLLAPANAASVAWSGKDLPGIAIDSRIIWGLTYRLLTAWLDLLRRS